MSSHRAVTVLRISNHPTKDAAAAVGTTDCRLTDTVLSIPAIINADVERCEYLPVLYSPPPGRCKPAT